jgi:hypothetical protein
LTDKQLLFDELIKPEICDSIESVARMVYKAPALIAEERSEPPMDQHAILLKQIERQKREMLDTFIVSFENEKKRLPTLEEIQDNIEETMSGDLVQAVLSDIDYKKNTNAIYSSSV